MKNIKSNTLALMSFLAISYLVCVSTAFILPSGYTMAPFLESILPGFKWISFSSFIYGLIDSVLIGAYTGLVFTPIYNFFNKE